MSYFVLLLVITPLSIQCYDELPNLSRVDRLLDDRYGTRNQRESNYAPRSYSEEMHLNQINSNIRGDWSKVKNRREDSDSKTQLRNNRPIPQSKLSTEANNKVLPIPVFIPIFMSHPYAVPIFQHPMNFSTTQTTRRPNDDIHKHEHVVLIRDDEHHSQGHGHEHDYDHAH